ncbi:hypothetical protein LEP1GSC127_4346 [Leptospira kirschneri str. 200801925]|nr:hypothetical protein LEP1GSC127_4346 [Leptospira kirschneri str. 200801925]
MDSLFSIFKIFTRNTYRNRYRPNFSRNRPTLDRLHDRFIFNQSIFKKRFQISEYFIFGIFFLLYALTAFPEKFPINPQKKSFNVSQKNPFGKPEKIFQEKFREQILLDLKEAELEKIPIESL